MNVVVQEYSMHRPGILYLYYSELRLELHSVHLQIFNFYTPSNQINSPKPRYYRDFVL